MKISKIFTAITLSSVFAFLSSYPTPKISELKAQTLTVRPLAILVNGQGDCCVQDMVSVGNYLNSINADVYISPWNSSLLIPWNSFSNNTDYEGSSDLNDRELAKK